MRIGLDARLFQSPAVDAGTVAFAEILTGSLARRIGPDDEIVALVDPLGPDVGPRLTTMLHGRPPRLVEYPEPRFRRLAKLFRPVTAERERILERETDVFVQFDANLGLPERTPSVLLVADLVALAHGDRHPNRHRPTFRGARRAGLVLPEAAYRAVTRRLYEQHLATALGRARLVLTPLDHTARLLAARHPGGPSAARDRIRVATVDTVDAGDATGVNALERNRIRGLGLDRDPFVLFVGSSHDGSRLDHLIAAFNDLRARGRRVSLVLAGEDLETVETMVDGRSARAVRASSYRDDVHLLGAVSAPMRRWLLTEAAVIALPGEIIGFGSGFADARAVGRSVVATDHPAVREQVGPGSRLVSARWEDLSEAIGAALDEPAEADGVRTDDETDPARPDVPDMGELLVGTLRGTAP